MKSVTKIGLFAALAALAATAQCQTNTSLSYDVVTIKVSHPANMNSSRFSMRDTTLQTSNQSLKTLISVAYGIREGLIAGLPAWADAARYDINAKVIDPDPKLYNGMTTEQRQTMLANLLADRFLLKAHTEVKTLPVYELTMAKDGPKFKENVPAVQTDPSKPIPLSQMSGSVNTGKNRFDGIGISIPRFATELEGTVSRTVVDKTGLKARYDLRLRWTPDDAPPPMLNGAPDPNPPPNIFTALQEQLGLKLVPAKGSVATLVIDHIEQPTEN